MKKTITLLLSSLIFLSAETTLIKDDVHKLMWEDTKHVDETKINHIQARSYCKNLELGELNWRIPTLTELLSIVDYKSYKPAILKEFNRVDNDTLYWSSTPYARSSDEYWGVSFKDGSTSNASETYDRLVRCVADIK